ncbi:putative inactive dehydrogenase EasA [Mycena venus]|uniref:Putative inactive dehydrogenase EasA n=1 Tax=Mycena venus TaxID=2733690 RepID=A0A8H6XVT2_9AGAR|nr:putative inactive dehydrogenase EasA [Mycena venus]
MSSSKLFQPTIVGDIELGHRVVFAPTTRFRADAAHAPLPHVAEYYGQRASQPGSLLISEATFIAPRAGGYKHAPGIWSDEQISAWKAVTDTVHAKGSYMYLQLWALGRAADADTLAEDGLPFVSASDVPVQGGPAPRPLTVEEIQEYIELYATAASNAVHKAGFDGVEIHSANGYLLDQFLHDRSNIRTDAYGGSIENRTRFPLEVVDAVVKAVGQKKTALRVSPWGTVLDMQFADHDPKPTYTHLVTQLRNRFPELAYLHVVEPRVDGAETVAIKDGYSNDFIRAIWGNRPLISAGGYTRETAIAAAEDKGDLIAFGRGYIANPDLPYRLLHGIALSVGNRALYYAPGSVDPKGYTDYPFAAPTIQAH